MIRRSSSPCSDSRRSSIALHYAADLGSTSEFVLAALALVPLAWIIGEATEHAAEHTGPGIGGFLNATFGNAPELIIALLAVHEGLTEVVRGSLTGSVIGNLLLVLGLLARRRRRRASRPPFELSTSLGDRRGRGPAVPDPRGDGLERRSRAALVAVASIPVAIVLLGRLRGRHHAARSAGTRPCTSRATRRSRAGRCGRPLLALGVATVATAFVAEVLVGSLEEFADEGGASRLLRRRGDRRDRRQRGRARRSSDRRRPRARSRSRSRSPSRPQPRWPCS